MIVVMRYGATDDEVQQVCQMLEEAGYKSAVWRGVERTVIGAIGVIDEEVKTRLMEQIGSLPFVENVIRILRPYKLVSREWKQEPTLVPIRDKLVGSNHLIIMAGPCSVESREQIREAALGVRRYGADVLRGGAFKPRTSPHTFQGLGHGGLQLLKEAADEAGLPIVTEVMDPRDVEAVSEVADVLQIGTRNMQNFSLLREVGQLRKPVLLKRGMSATIEEWLQAAEYICVEGNPYIILCERGIRTFETYTRNTLDISAIVAAKQLSHLPVIADPSHGTGRRDMIIPMALAAIAAGADGLIVEVHPNPARALSDGAQSLSLEQFKQLMIALEPIATAVGRSLYNPPSQTLLADSIEGDSLRDGAKEQKFPVKLYGETDEGRESEALEQKFPVKRDGETDEGRESEALEQKFPVKRDGETENLPLNPFEFGVLVGLLIGEGHVGSDGRQPQITVRMHVQYEPLFRWLLEKVPGSKLYGPYHHGGRHYYQWMVRGRALKHLCALLEQVPWEQLDPRTAERLLRIKALFGRKGAST